MTDAWTPEQWAREFRSEQLAQDLDDLDATWHCTPQEDLEASQEDYDSE